MNDQDFLNQFEVCSLPKEHFKHRGHLRIAWLYLDKYPYPEAVRAVRTGIMKYAASLGAAQIFHETVTLTWIQLVAAARHKKDTSSFDDFMAENPELANSKLIYEYYSPELLQTETAKNAWQPPDLQKLPVDIDQFR